MFAPETIALICKFARVGCIATVAPFARAISPLSKLIVDTSGGGLEPGAYGHSATQPVAVGVTIVAFSATACGRGADDGIPHNPRGHRQEVRIAFERNRLTRKSPPAAEVVKWSGEADSQAD